MSTPPNPLPQPNSPTPINIEIPNDLKAHYANFALIMHTPSEVILNFTSVLPGMTTAQIDTRIVMTPLHAKLMLNALADNLQKYEAQFGEIKLPPGGTGLAEQLFGGAKPIGS
jgi:hypothetical protein